jgi:hypothetical protein
MHRLNSHFMSTEMSDFDLHQKHLRACNILTCIYIRVFNTSRGKQAVTDITDAKLLAKKRTFAEIGFYTAWSSLLLGFAAAFSLLLFEEVLAINFKYIIY